MKFVQINCVINDSIKLLEKALESEKKYNLKKSVYFFNFLFGKQHIKNPYSKDV